MNNDLIKRIAVCDMLHEEMGAWGNCADEIEALLKANDALWEIPAVDAVEVVRCKDCKYRSGLHGRPPLMFRVCTCAEGLTGAVRDENFCSYGERREDG